ncbi:hypothetical protein AX774_g4515 [Zancudomyces culisetae]|uniref:Uncharacterized protein n=1 Tax=Zancudomyces culisetae TaxID=1213189 RepID=A0A1R1PMB8_ZANCU|nr:hypothetical protein AX774_g4515 [Zancudomyces culisetae]|eukprot:OMH82022.1 hypothetical protein AX774_g4515 [Zancudomyces culisetae]
MQMADSAIIRLFLPVPLSLLQFPQKASDVFFVWYSCGNAYMSSFFRSLLLPRFIRGHIHEKDSIVKIFELSSGLISAFSSVTSLSSSDSPR